MIAVATHLYYSKAQMASEWRGAPGNPMPVPSSQPQLIADWRRIEQDKPASPGAAATVCGKVLSASGVQRRHTGEKLYRPSSFTATSGRRASAESLDSRSQYGGI